MAVEKPLAQIWSRTEFRCETVAAALALIAVVVLSAIALVDPGLADRATAENGAVEWFQVLLDAAATVLFGRHLARNASRAGRVSPLDVVIELFERQLGHVPGVPHYFLEELFELVAGIGFLVSAVARRSGV